MREERSYYVHSSMQVYDGISRLHKIYLINIILKDTKEGEKEREREREILYILIFMFMCIWYFIY